MEKSAFLFYGSFQDSIKELPDETRLRFYDAIINYGLTGTAPEFTGLEKALWLQIQFAIDEAKNRRETSKNNGLKGGRPAKTNKPTETQENPEKPNKTQDNQEKPEITQRNPEKPNPNLNEEVDVDEEVDVEGETECAAAQDALTLSSSLYANKVFDIFTAAQLPNAGNNRVGFLMRDFKNGMDYIHNQKELKHLHSADILGACENYAKVLQDPGTYVTNRYSFDRLVKTKNFTDYLPDNFCADNFKTWKQTDEKPAAQERIKPAADPFLIHNAPRICELCREPTRESASGGGFLAVSCTRCGSWAEYNPETKKWDWEKR